MILPRPPVRTERAKQRCGETPGQEQKNDIQADRQKNDMQLATTMSITVMSITVTSIGLWPPQSQSTA